MAINYKIKCEKCEKFIDRDKIINNFGRKTCKECLKKQTITKSYMLYIPRFILEEAKIKTLEKVILINTEEGIIIKKIKG